MPIILALYISKLFLDFKHYKPYAQSENYALDTVQEVADRAISA